MRFWIYILKVHYLRVLVFVLNFEWSNNPFIARSVTTTLSIITSFYDFSSSNERIRSITGDFGRKINNAPCTVFVVYETIWMEHPLSTLRAIYKKYLTQKLQIMSSKHSTVFFLRIFFSIFQFFAIKSIYRISRRIYQTVRVEEGPCSKLRRSFMFQIALQSQMTFITCLVFLWGLGGYYLMTFLHYFMFSSF